MFLDLVFNFSYKFFHLVFLQRNTFLFKEFRDTATCILSFFNHHSFILTNKQTVLIALN